MEQPVKQKFDFDYWIEQLVIAGSKVNPEKFTEDYKRKLKNAWRGQPLSNLSLKVVERRNQNQ